jgi:hypothetical protein
MENKAASDRFRQVLVQIWPKQGYDRTSAIIVVYFDGEEL